MAQGRVGVSGFFRGSGVGFLLCKFGTSTCSNSTVVTSPPESSTHLETLKHRSRTILFVSWY